MQRKEGSAEETRYIAHRVQRYMTQRRGKNALLHPQQPLSPRLEREREKAAWRPALKFGQQTDVVSISPLPLVFTSAPVPDTSLQKMPVHWLAMIGNGKKIATLPRTHRDKRTRVTPCSQD